jgi:hypothetical protein
VIHLPLAYLTSPTGGVNRRHIPSSRDDKDMADGYGLLGLKRKALFWDEVIRYAEAHRQEKAILLGDLNTGFNDVDKTPEGEAFKLWEKIIELREAGYTDTWRELNPETREYTWFSGKAVKTITASGSTMRSCHRHCMTASRTQSMFTMSGARLRMGSCRTMRFLLLTCT